MKNLQNGVEYADKIISKQIFKRRRTAKEKVIKLRALLLFSPTEEIN